MNSRAGVLNDRKNMEFIFANILHGLAQTLRYICVFLQYLVLGSVIISWVDASPYNPIVRFINTMTEPFYGLIRRFLPTRIGMMDITPLILILGIMLFEEIVVRSLFELGLRIRGGVPIGY